MKPGHLKRSKKSGLSPGSLIHIGNTYSEKSKITISQYNETFFSQNNVGSPDDLPKEKDESSVFWLTIDGLQDTGLLEKLGNFFNLHPLVLEDILNTNQRPKIEDYGEYLYIVLHNFTVGNKGSLISEQISIILGNNFVLSFREKESSVFETVVERLSGDKGRIRKSGADYLAYALIDNVVDNYFLILEELEDKIEYLEDSLIRKPAPSTLQAIHALKNDLILLRKSLWPLREAINYLERSDSRLIDKSTGIYFRDISDHVITIIETVETFRDTLSNMMDIYLSSVNIKLNEVMKVLAIIATIFMPLTFIAGVYGMNFKYMPELEWRSGYFGVLGIMLVVALFMIYYFHRKKWF